MEPLPPATSPPWRFRLMALATGGALLCAGILTRSALARRADQQLRSELIAELQRVDAAQSQWAARTGRFAEQVAEVPGDGVLALTPSPRVILRFIHRSPDGWSAIVESREALAAPAHCGIYRGPPTASPHRAVVHPGQVVCW